ncbi:MAG: hypothetical protein A2798_02195 [Candidatus Levybacteria bacterium RIFCSPHIGHO2_01_FULL_37_17]|nr:MAG: hypothetical protein A2798_02195 [Candidatus Levybacteria bacterium RIFCSPHIGHO2_01_FULL_37_17]OGH36689.1 MAG: hypothetical protein A2959_00185 [Candidatus Levybacteria bacterium RIFCSPLOWO2_01_FULL_38_23]
MKVLFLTRSFYPNVGGVEKHIYKLSEVLLRNDIEVTIVTEKSYSNYYHSDFASANNLGSNQINVIEIEPGRNDWFKKFRIWKELAFKISYIKNADIVHCHDVYFWYIPFRLLFPLKRNFVTFHGYEGNKIPNFKAVFMHKLAEFLSNGNICVGNFLEKWYGTKPDIVTYGAVDKKLLQNKKKDNIKIKKGIFIGRLEYETGILEYLKAISNIKKEGINIQLDVFGNGSLKRKAIRFAKINELSVNFKGAVINLENQLTGYNFAFVSRYLAILEAMAIKLAVLAHYNNKIKKDYLEMTPFANYITISNDPGIIAKEVKERLENKDERVEKAYQWAKKQTWENLAKIYLRLWNSY